jgi:hypothetical protein
MSSRYVNLFVQAEPLPGEHPDRFGSVGCARRRLSHQWDPAGHMIKTGPRRIREEKRPAFQVSHLVVWVYSLEFLSDPIE